MSHDPPSRRRETVRVALLASTVLGQLAAPVAQAQDLPAPTGSIAYLVGREEVRVIHADGTGDRLVFRVPSDTVYGIEDVAWRHDGDELAIASGHEALCSIWQDDLYLMDVLGSDVRRLTNGPACGELAGLASGTMTVTLENRLLDTDQFFIHIQGLEIANAVTLEPGFRGTFEVSGVRDLGPDTPQFPVVSAASARWFDPAVYGDVDPEAAVHAGTVVLDSATAFDTWGALSVTWSHDGSRLGYQQGLGSLWQIDRDAPELSVGRTLFASDVTGDVAATSLAWSPVDDRVLYARYDTTPPTIDLGTADADDAGDAVIASVLVDGIAWMPDGTGFIASDRGTLLDTANLWQTDLATGAVTQITGYQAGFAIWPSVSPDGGFVVYGYSPVALEQATSVELRIRHLATAADQLLVPNGLNPDWSR